MEATQGINKFDTVYPDFQEPEIKYVNVPWKPEYMVYMPQEVKVSSFDIIIHELINRKLINDAIFLAACTIW